MTRHKYLAENGSYLSDEAKSVLAKLTDDEFEVLLELTEELTGSNEPGLDCDLALTAETVEDWKSSAKTWRERGATEDSGENVIFRRVQMHKGEQRHDIAVLACQDKSVVLTTV